MIMKIDDRIREQLRIISEKLQAIEEMNAWLIKADSRFRVGQRVEWSRRAKTAGFPRRKIAMRGTVKEINCFSIAVQLDGLKQVNSFHHAFFNPISGPKLF